MKQISFHSLRVLSVAVILCAVVGGAFQNCTEVKTASGPSSSLNSASSTGGSGGTGPVVINHNGTGYDGKVYVRRLSARLCDDGTNVAVAINFKAGIEAQLVRVDCKNIPAQTLPLAQVSVAPFDSNILIYQSNAYEDSNSIVPTSLAYLACYDSGKTIDIIIIQTNAGNLTGRMNQSGYASGRFPVSKTMGTAPVATFKGVASENNVVTLTVTAQNTNGSYNANITVDYNGGAGGIFSSSGTCYLQ